MSDPVTLTQSQWDCIHADFRGEWKGQPSRLTLDPASGATILEPVQIIPDPPPPSLAQRIVDLLEVVTQRFGSAMINEARAILAELPESWTVTDLDPPAYPAGMTWAEFAESAWEPELYADPNAAPGSADELPADCWDIPTGETILPGNDSPDNPAIIDPTPVTGGAPDVLPMPPMKPTRFIDTCGDPSNPQLRAILDCPLPAIVSPSLRRESRKVWAAEVRKLLRSLGIKGVSVTAPNYSMASSIDIHIPAAAEHDRGAAGHEYLSCPTCGQHTRAEKKIRDIILAAFPDLNDRSESQSDYFDFCLSIN